MSDSDLELRDVSVRTPPREDAHLSRVRSAIGAVIASWLRARGVGAVFRASQLRAHVAEVCGEKAPASADRILRALRRDGVVAYIVVDRRASLYRLTWVMP